MSKLRTAILGYGRSGSALHAEAVAANPDDFEMVAACDTDAERRKLAAERFGCAVYDDYREMLDKEQLDLVSIVTRSDQHCEMTCDCLEAGVNVLVTKPWAVNAAEAERMVETAERTGKQLLPWLPRRWGAVVRRLKQLVAEGAIGEVFLGRCAASSFATRCDWQTEKRCGGGYLLNWGPHLVDPIPFILESPVRSVYGRMKQTINPGDTEDVFLAVMTLENGAVCQAEYTISVEDLPNFMLQGTRGTIVARKNHLTIYKNTPAEPSDPTRFSSMKSEQEETIEEDVTGLQYGDGAEIYHDVAKALRGEEPYAATAYMALDLSKVLDAIRTSSAEDRVVHLD